jgi:hypothetical protein
MPPPGKLLKPLGDHVRQIPRPQYNEMLRRVSANLLPFSDIDANKNPLLASLRLVECADPATGLAAPVVYYDIDAGAWATNADHTIDLSSYGSTEMVIPKAERVVEIYHRQSGKFIPVSLPEVVRFELKSAETLVPGGSAKAHLREYSGGSYTPNPDTEITVHDPDSQYRCSSPPSGQGGVRGKARYFPDLDAFEIISMQHQARWIEWRVNETGGFSTADATAIMDDLIYHDGYTPTVAPTTVYNARTRASAWLFEGDDNDCGLAKYDYLTDRYYISQFECPT